MSEDLLPEFVPEAREQLAQAVQDLLALEAAPEDTGALESLFRAIHTLKGSAGLIAFQPMERLFHLAEDRMGEVRQGARVLDPDLIGALLGAVWAGDRWVEAIDAEGRLPPEAAAEAEPLVTALSLAGEGAPAAATPAHRAPDWTAELLTAAPASAGGGVAFRYAPLEDSYFAGDDPLAVIASVPGLVWMDIQARAPFGDLATYDPFACNLVIRGLSTASLSEVKEAFRFVGDQAEVTEVQREAQEAVTGADSRSRTVRVDGERLDHLGAAANELVVAKNTLAHLTARAAAGADAQLARALAAAGADLDRQVRRLHDTITRLRMTPLAGLFRRFPGVVRQTSAKLGKPATLVLSGEQVEVDKSVADGLYEPLLHLVRNALDHGIEAPAERRAAGKATPAILRLSARTVGDEVLIELADDGRGLDLAHIGRVAQDRGLASAEMLAAMSHAEIIDLIFRPGFSTAKSVTDLSGRGVGLDAVRTAADALGGRVAVETRAGAGSRFILTLPLRVRLERLMMVEAAGETYGVPLDAVVETTRVALDRLTPVRHGRAMVWRDQALPFLRLSDLLALEPTADAAELKVMIVQAGDELAAVGVDAFGDRIEAPLRPLGGMLSRVPGVSGASLLGDGRVLMVLDLPELIG